MRALRETVDQLRNETVPLVSDLRGTVGQANAELARVDNLLGTAESISATVDSASRLAYLAFSNPVIKALAFGSGTARAVRRLRRRATSGRPMFKRLFWLMIGLGFGFGVSFWLMRFVRKTVERYSPDRVSNDLAAAVRGFGKDLRAAVAEGREAMRDREIEIRDEITSGNGPEAGRSAIEPLAPRCVTGRQPEGPTGGR